jgi:hypothetical protein
MSLASRTLRTTAAAAGVAALGVAVAGNAFAAPAAPTPSQPDLLSGSAAGLPALPNGSPLAQLPGVPEEPALPTLFVFQGPTVHTPTVNTAGPSGGVAPGVGELRRPAAAPVRTSPDGPAATRTAPPANVDGQVGPNRVAPTSSPTDRVGALSELDSAGMFDGLVGRSVVDQHGLGTSSLGWLG